MDRQMIKMLVLVGVMSLVSGTVAHAEDVKKDKYQPDLSRSLRR